MRKKKEEREAEKEDELREIRRPAKSFCVARLVTAGDPEHLEGVYKQVKGCGSSAWFGHHWSSLVPIGTIYLCTLLCDKTCTIKTKIYMEGKFQSIRLHFD